MKNVAASGWRYCVLRFLVGVALAASLALASCSPRNAPRQPAGETPKQATPNASAKLDKAERPSAPEPPEEPHSTTGDIATGATRDASGNITLNRVELYDPPGEWGRPKPASVTLSPNGRHLAVIAEGAERLVERASRWLEVLSIAGGS